ncbi:site-specific DNA-methyltransferase [Mycobacteroides abscessus]|uniref:site-specific DNA-methyltransferase n=1 Tax=Mycobacteroides abscessus TaxID=36809 RepID=UPI0005DF37E2|nr:DNA methyltransferase [Mycobacteroides abscessus]CPR69890.1 adenine specific DNA methylase Mod [Mycobacteroides abscessus]CPU70492.1 adenine specific DNA methylase Mod [Mycobacteroides abscessus]
MADETNVLDQLIGRIQDESLRNRLSSEVELLRGSRRFGLLFDRHLPESVRLTDYPIRKGIRVALRDESSADTWIVERFTDRTREVAVLSGDGGERQASDLIVIREFGEPIYPGLHSVERIPNGPQDAPWHLVINGENFHALQALRSTHREKVDLIYIDPPYNTGNEGWIYNDRYVDQNDRAKSSKWLSFLERRLRIARDLLKPTGVIIVAIGDEEHHRLRMLLDQVFGDQNFISDVVWQGGRKNDSRYVSNGADYMLIYARDESALAGREIRWREEKPGVQEVLEQGAAVWAEHGPDESAATEAMRAWFSAQPKESVVRALSRNIYFLPDGTLCGDADTRSPSPRPNLRYELLHPTTGKPCRMHPNGWAYSEEKMHQMIAEGRIIFRGSHNDYVRFKRPLESSSGSVAQSVFDRQRTHSGRHLQDIFGDKRFPFPKDHEVLMRWFRLAAPVDAVILDFFGGSGTTTEAVMQLNAEDGGTRQSILVTNNELGAREAKKLRSEDVHPGDPEWEQRGVFEYVCRPRISTVVTGKRPDGSVYSEGLAANVEMFDLTYLDPSAVRRGQEFSAVAPLFWLEGGARGERIEDLPAEGWALTDAYGVLFDIDALTEFAAAVADASIAGRAPAVLFIITDSPAEYQQTTERLPVGIDTVQLYEDYLSNYTINTVGGAR